MRFTTFVKSQFGALGIQEVLKSSPSVLLGVNATTEQTLATLRIRTVFDLAMSPLFGNASRVLNGGTDIGSSYRKFGRAPSSVIDKSLLTLEAVTALPLDEIKTLIGVGPQNGPAIANQLSVQAVRDLALWPPYLAAKAIVVEAYGLPTPDVRDPEAPLELVPASGEFGTERHMYSSVVMFPGTYEKSYPLNHTLFDVTATPLEGFTHMRFGARVTYSQTWFPKFVAKGQLLHSLPLAPGESTNVAVIDWSNKSKAATEQQISESERLSSTNDRTRTISQISNSVAKDYESGSSETFGQSASAQGGGMAFLGMGFGSASVGVSESTTTTHTVSTGTRSIASSLQQNIVDSTQQNSSAVRSQRAAVVSEVSQSDRRNFSTRNVTNYNHMHALTLQYYEVVQIYETQVRPEDVERCIFIPMALFDFRDERIIFKYLGILKRVALNYETRAMMRQLEEGGYGYSFKWARQRVANNILSHPIVRPFVRDVLRSYRVLDNRGFVKVLAPAAPLNDGMQLNYQLQLNNVVVLNSRSQAPRSLVSGVDIDLEDGSTISVTTTPQGSAPDPTTINAAFGGQSVSFGRIRALRLRTAAYAPAASNLAQRVIRLRLAVKLNGESRYLDASFVMSGTAASYSGATLFTIDPLPELELLEEELMAHQLFYSQQIWLRENPQTLIMQFAPITITLGGNTINLVDYITPTPLKVVGNYLVYKFTYEKDHEWQEWLRAHFDRSRIVADSVAVPTGGVFAEGVLGRFNAAEKLDLTRFAHWNDSPPPVRPPTINAVKFTEPALPTTPSQATFSAPLVNIQAPIPLPQATGLTEVLLNLVKSAAFPDVSGIVKTGELAEKQTQLSSQNSINALKTNAQALTHMITSLSNVLGTALSKDATKTLSDVGALLNKKDEKDGAAGKTDENKTEGDGGGTATPPSNNGASGGASATNAEARVLDDAIAGSVLASLASGVEADTATDAAAGGGVTAVDSDQALLNSTLITEPTFADVLGFLVLLQLIPDDNLLDVVEKRFATLATTVDSKAKFTEVLNTFTAHSGSLMNADRILFALRFQKASLLPDNSTLDQTQIAKVKELATTKMVTRAMTIARRVNTGSDAEDVLEQIFSIANGETLYDINHIAYILATAYHESAMGTFMTELANGISTDTVFTKDEYFFEAIAGRKNSYNGVNGNQLAGDQLLANGDIAAAPDVATWNGNTYPHAQPAAVKIAARTCDYYRFIGRGLVQITGRDNYQRYSNLVAFGHEDFTANPEKVADAEVAARILVTGMMAGDFRASKLADFDTAAGFDGVNARDIVNGDKATNGQRIRDIAVEFKDSLIINTKLDESVKYL
jgi:hypothetical protein